MICFEVHLNGKRLCLAGIQNDGAMSVFVNWIGERGGPDPDVFMAVGGSDSREGNGDWVGHAGLSVGDEIHVRVVESTSPDVPAWRKLG